MVRTGHVNPVEARRLGQPGGGVTGPRRRVGHEHLARAGATATILHQATRSPVLIGGDPVTVSADRPSPSESARTGQASADTGTATITAA